MEGVECWVEGSDGVSECSCVRGVCVCSERCPKHSFTLSYHSRNGVSFIYLFVSFGSHIRFFPFSFY